MVTLRARLKRANLSGLLLQRGLPPDITGLPGEKNSFAGRVFSRLTQSWQPEWPAVALYYSVAGEQEHEILMVASEYDTRVLDYALVLIDSLEETNRPYGGTGKQHREFCQLRLKTALQYHRLVPGNPLAALPHLALTSQRLQYGSLPHGSLMPVGSTSKMT